MENQPEQKNSMSMPVAIVVAGALIAVAVYFSNASQPSSTPNQPAQQAAAQTSQVSKADITITPVSTEDHYLGNPDAPLSVVVYTDPECPFCKSFHVTMQRLMNTYGKNGEILWVYRDFPIPALHPRAPNETHATECAAAQGGQQVYWAYFNKLFEITPSNNGLDPAQLPQIASQVGLDVQKFNDCQASGAYNDLIDKEYQEAMDAGGQGTPFSVFVLKSPISDATFSAITAISNSNNFPPGTFVLSTDKLRMSMSGSLPYATVQQVVDLLLGKS